MRSPETFTCFSGGLRRDLADMELSLASLQTAPVRTWGPVGRWVRQQGSRHLFDPSIIVQPHSIKTSGGWVLAEIVPPLQARWQTYLDLAHTNPNTG